MFEFTRDRARSTALALLAVALLAVGTPPTTPAVATGNVTEGSTATGGKRGPISVVYVEVNRNRMVREVGRYKLVRGHQNVFDIGIVFAANINYDQRTKTAYLHLNDNVRWVLENADTQIRPLQQQGIKVTLSVIGNHEGAGLANFPSQPAAAAFAGQLADVVTEYGLDGIDFDDEYADYGANGTGEPNDSSFVHLVSALRKELPGKLITLYYIGEASTRLSYDGVDVTSMIDYSWNPWYGSWQVPGIKLPKERLSPAAVEIGGTPYDDAVDLARRTVREGYGVFLTYNLGDSDSHEYISGFTRELYNSEAFYTG